MLPDDWRERLLRQVTGAAPPDPALFAGGPFLEPIAQIEVYRRQYRLRLTDAVREELAGLAALVGADGGEIDTLIADYLRVHPSTSWTLNRVADHFPAWLAARPYTPAAWREMCALDRAVNEGFEAADGEAIRPEQRQSAPRLALQPHVHLLRFQWSVHRTRAAALGGSELPALEAGDFPVVVFRANRRMRHLQLHPVAWALLERLNAGRALGEAIGDVVAAGAPVSLLQASLQSWFAFYVEHGLLRAET